MDFLVHVDVKRAYDLPADEFDDVLRRERERGRELIAAGVIRDIWRVLGRRANVGIWSAADAEELEKVLSTLPIYRYADIQVTPLVTHPMRAAA
jgi:muconolactone D-isomerase